MCEHPNNPYYTDTTMFKYWSKELLCGGGNLQLGSCNNHGECICKAGYTHDMTFSRFRVCNLPVMFLPIWYGLQFPLSAVIFCIIFKSYRESTSIARLTLLSNLLCVLFYMLYCIFQFAFDYKANGWMFAAIFMIVTCTSASSSLALYSFMSPLSIAANKSPKMVRDVIVIFFIAFRVIGFIPFIIALVLYDDINDPTKDKGWNNMTEIYTLLVAFEAGSQSAFLVIKGTKLIRYINEISQNLGSMIEAKSKISNSYIQKVQLMIRRFIVLFVPLTVIMCTAPIIQLQTNYIPFDYIFAVLSVGSAPLISYSASKYAAKFSQKVSSSSSPELTNTPQPMHMVKPHASSSLENTAKSEPGNPQGSAKVMSSSINENLNTSC